MSETNRHIPEPGGYEEFASGDAHYRMKWIGPGIKKSFSKYLRARAWAILEEDRPGQELPEAERAIAARSFIRREKLLSDKMDSGAYQWGSPLDPDGMGSAVSEALDEGEPWVKLAQLLLEEHHGLLNPAELDRVSAGNKPAFDRAMKRCLDPNRSAPVPTPGQSTSPASSPVPA